MVKPSPSHRTGSNKGLRMAAINKVFAGLRGVLRSKVSQCRACDVYSVLLCSEKKRIAKTRFSLEAFIGNRQDSTSFSLPYLANGQKCRRDHIYAGNVLLIELINQFRRFLK